MSSNLEKYFDNNANEKESGTGYQLFFRDVEINEVIAYLPRNGRVLEIGCGNGKILQEIKKRRPDLELYGIDFSKEMIHYAKKRLGENAHLEVANMLELPFENNTFDYVYSVRAIINIQEEKDKIIAINEVYRVLKDECIALLFEMSEKSIAGTNNFLKKIGLKELTPHWHNKYFSSQMEEYIALRFASKVYYWRVTSLLKCVPESMTRKYTKLKVEDYQSKLHGVSNFVGRITYFFDKLLNFYGIGKPFGRHTEYVLYKGNGRV